MIVQCPECSSQYRVDDDKIPDSGGKISCPQCSNQFVVYPDDEQEESSGGEARDRPDPDSTEVADRGRLQEMAAQYDGGDVDDSGGGGGDEEQDATYVMSPDELPSALGDDEEEEEEEFPDDPLAQEGTVEMQSPLEGGEDVLDAVDEATTDSISADDVPEPGDEWGPEGGDGGDGGGRETRAGMGSDPLGTLEEDDDQGTTEGSGARRTSVPDEPTMETEGAGEASSRSGGSSGAGPEQATMEQDAPEPPSQPERGGATMEEDAPSPPQQGDHGGPSRGGSPQNSSGELGGGGSGAAVGGGQSAGSAGQPVGGGGPPADHDGPWKLEAEHGLTYEFPETDSLRDWLQDRDGIDSFELSADGGSTFYPLPDFPQVADLVGGESGGGGRGAEPGGPPRTGPGGSGPDAPGAGSSAPGSGPSGSPTGPDASGAGGGTGADIGGGAGSSGDFGGGGDFTSGGPQGGRGGGAPAGGSGQRAPGDSPGGSGARQSGSSPRPGGREPSATGGDFELPSEDDDENEAVLYGVFVVLLVVAVGVGLDVAGVFPVGRYVPGVPTSFEETDEAEGIAGGGVEEPDPTKGGAAKSKEKGSESGAQVERVLQAARRSLEENRLKSAKEELNAAKLLDPKRVEIYEMLAEVNEKLGKKKKAEQNRKRARKLKADEAGEPSTGKGGNAKGAAAEPDSGRKQPTN